MTLKNPSLSIRFKKFVSSFLIFALLFGQTVHIPLLQTTQAAESDFPNLVAILVHEDVFSSALKRKIERYAEDVQTHLEASRASIVSIPADATPEKIAALLEKLYYEGDGKGVSRLVGTVLVGDLPLPVVHRGEKTFLSVFPYVDFVDKSFVYDSEKGYYEYTSVPAASDVPEIWHGIIRPHTGNADEDRQKLEAFFDKTREYYSKSGRFEASKFRIQPHVFYFDSYRDQLNARSSEWKSYQLMLEYAEDLAYNRFSKHLANTVYQAYQGYLGSDVPNAAGTEIGDILAAYTGSTLDFRSAPDIQTREPIEKSLKRFFEVLSEKYLGDILRYVHNAGRYGAWNGVRADIPAIIVGKSDELMKRSLKDANTAFEDSIDALVRGGLARHVAVGLTHSINESSATAGTPGAEGTSATPGTSSSSSRTYRNYLYGKPGADISKAEDCSIVRGSSLAVEANRGYDVSNSQSDVSLLQNDLPNGRCFPGGKPAAMSFWGNNTPLKLDVSRSNEGIMTLQWNVYDGFIKPIFDVGGSKEIVANATLPIASPLDCTRQRLWISDPYVVEDALGGGRTGFPAERPGQPITCITDTVGNSLAVDSFENYFTKGFPSENCTVHHLLLDGTEVLQSGGWCDSGDGAYTHIDKTYAYKKVLSVIEHKSPTDHEYGEQLKNFLTPSLPADKDRYVDFISAKGTHVKLSYPNLFRISLPEEDDVTPERARAEIERVLDAKSAEINGLIASEAGSGPLYEALKNGPYPSSKKIDLYAGLAAKPEMLESVVDAVVWNNLGSATAKYAYLLEHHLDIDGNASYPLAGHKEDYEISYLVGKGDARNLYVKLDPAAKDGPGEEVSEILRRSAEQLAAMDAANIGAGAGDEKAEFQCGPPDGVNLPQWLPAIFCWLWTILPPTISAGSCSPNSAFDIAELIAKHFGNDSNKNGMPDWQEDSNKNGIIDGAEYVKDGNIRLNLAPRRAPYRESVAISAVLEDKNGIQVYVDSLSEVSFDVSRVVAYSGGVAVEKYRRGAEGELGNSVNVKDYVNFSQLSVRAKEGKADYVFSTKDRDADVYFDATVSPRDKDGKAAFVKTSAEAKLEIRSETLRVGLTSSGASISTYAKAGEYREISFPVEKIGKNGARLDLAFPLAVRIFDDDTSKQIGDTMVATKTPWTYAGSILNQSGNYRFEFTDKEGVTGSVSFTVSAGKAVKMELSPSSSLFVKNETVTVLAKISDQFGNVVRGDLIDLAAKISGGGYFVENKSDTLNKAIVDGYTTFEISSNDGGKELTFELEAKNRGLSSSVKFGSLDYAKAVVNVENRNALVVGTGSHLVTIRVVDKSGNELSGFDSVATVSFPKLSGTFDTNYVALKNAKSSTGFLLSPKYVAGKDLKIDVRIPGIRDVEGNVVTVLPDAAMRVALQTEKPVIEAKTGETESVFARLFDRYGNLAYNHSEWAYSAKFSIPEHFKKNLRFPGKTFEAESKFSGGIAEVKVETTRLPGTPYVIVEVSPGLESNAFAVSDASGASVTVSGYSKNAVPVDSYYLWNKEKVAKLEYNGLYTVLGGADFGNLTERDYLAGEILFNPDSRSMAVTALLNDATVRNRVFSITPGGKVNVTADDSLITSEISSVAGRTSIGFYDPFYKEYVARAYLNFSEDASRVACRNDGTPRIDNCEIPSGSAFLALKGYANAAAVSQNGLALVVNGARVLEIDAWGAVSHLPNVRLEIDSENSKNFFAAKIFASNQEVGYFAARLRASDVVSTGPANVSQTLVQNPGKIVVETVSGRYSAISTFLGNSSRGAKGLTFFSNRDAESASDREMVGGPAKIGFEQYRESEGIGWEGQNKTLLEFAGGSSVGEATRFNMSFSTVNLGDPVFRVKKPENEGAYDRTLGTRLLDAVDDAIESYRRFDFNGDAYDDLVVFFESGKIRLFANMRGTLRDMGYLAYLADAGKNRKAVGDFTGDGYSDIAAVTKRGELIVLDNVEGKFVRKSAVILDASDNPAHIRGKIVQLEAYDMDSDGKTDLVISDDSGELNVLYGKVLDGKAVFTKKVLDSDLGLRLAMADRKDGGAVYFEGLKQLQNPTEPDQARYLAESAALSAAGDEGGIPPEMRTALIDSKIYYVHAYKFPVELTGSTLDSGLSERLSAAIGNDPENPTSPNTALKEQVMAAMNAARTNAGGGFFNVSGTYDETRYKTFLKSDFAEYQNVRVTKTFRDANGDLLKSEDPVEITILLGNSGSTTLRNVAYLDSFDKELFSPAETPSYSIGSPSFSKTGSLSVIETSSYDYLFEGFDLRPGETVTIKYSLLTNPVSFGKFFVGNIENDDAYGDVAMRANNICGEAMTVWKSAKPHPRSFEKVTRTFSSDQSSAGGLAGKFIDMNTNGQPDYIDVLAAEVPPSDLGDMRKYSYHLNGGGTQYDAKSFGILLFRQIADSTNGTVNSGNVEIARLVANEQKNHLQRSAEPGSGDMTVTVAASALNAIYEESTKTLRAGSQASTASGGLSECGSTGYVTTKAPEVIGWKQVANAPTSALEIFFSEGRHSKDGGKTDEACKMTFASNSNPEWNGGRVIGEGWKILTKHTYNSYVLAAKTADYRNSSSNVPDDYDERGTDLYSFDYPEGAFSVDGLTSGNVAEIEAAIDELVQGLGCGFWGGACISMPMNWAPLAPGSSPSVLGFPASSLVPSTGFPIFSALTGMPVGPLCIPSVWPATPFDLARWCGGTAAGGYLGDKGAANFFRFYVTPTLTGAIGVAACFGVVPAVTGRIPPQGVSPVVPGGNCVVAAKPLFGCKDDGSDGDVSSQGIGNADGFYNAKSCRPKSAVRTLTSGERALIGQYVNGVKSSGVTSGITAALPYISAGPSGFWSSPVVGIGLSSGQDPNFEVGIDPNAIKNFDPGNIVKIKLDRVSAFPEFIMDWVNRQTEEIINKLTSLPTLYIILPDFSKIYESGWNGFADNLVAKFRDGKTSYGPDKNFAIGTKYAEAASKQVNGILSDNQGTINSVGRNVSGLRTAYEFLSNLPIIVFETETVVVDIPMISDEDIDKAIFDFGKTAAQWKKEIGDKKTEWSKVASKDGVNEKVFVEAEATVASIEAWARFLEDAKRFPDKLYRYLTWKERYAEQILCNVESIEQMVGGYIAENGKRFRAWVELYVLLKAILKSWQLMVDLFYQHISDCGVCRNERYDLKHFIFKVISAVIPKIPIIKFPKWPDIVLDLHNIRLGLRILMPEFDFHISPIVLPHLPRLALPNVPGLGIGLPTVPAPPKFPNLPDLPDLPSLPVIDLPDLPPPPKIPKMFAAITGVLEILKLVSKILCILRKNPFVPEWRAGDQIAQITERQGKLGLDFLNIEFPNFSLAFVDAIRVTTFVNLEFQVDFILEMAKSTFQPINEFSTDLRSSVSSSVRDIGVPSEINLRDTVPQGDARIDIGGPQGMRGVPDEKTVADISKMTDGERKAVMTNFAWTLALSFKEFLAYLDREKSNELTLSEFKSALADEVAKLSGSDDKIVVQIADVLGRAARYQATDTSLEDRLMADNAEKFGIVKDSVRAEIEEVRSLKSKIEELERARASGSAQKWLSALGKTGLPETFASWSVQNGTDFAKRGEALKKFEDRAAEKMADLYLNRDDTETDELRHMGEALEKRVSSLTEESAKKERRLAQGGGNPFPILGGINTDPDGTGVLENGAAFRFDADEEKANLAADAAAEMGDAASFQFVYAGIYVTDEGRQSRLFDYTEELLGNEEAVLIDVAKTGHDDVVYSMGSSLFLKRNLKAPTQTASSDDVEIYDLSDILDRKTDPSAPNSFEENFVSSGQINFGFAPAKPSDQKFRLEFYDYVDRFDRIARKEDAPPTPKRSVDLFVENSEGTIIDAKNPGTVVRKNLAWFERMGGEGEVSYPDFRKLSGGTTMGVAAGRIVHTAGTSAKIRFSPSGEDPASASTVEIPKNGSVEFLATGDFFVESGEIYLIEDALKTSVRELSKIKGLPVLPGVRISMAKNASRIEIEYHDGASYSMRGPAEYSAYDLGAKSSGYSVSIDQSNDWYYAKLHAFEGKALGTAASLTLLSPQIQADKEGPLVEFPVHYRIPVYAKEIVNLKKYVRDVSGISDFFVDVDPETDRDGNKVSNDDRDSDSPETGGKFVRGNDWSELVVGPFDAPTTRKIRMVATDGNGNETARDVTVTAFVPTPSIQAATSARANGVIDAKVSGEPIDLFRYRGGKLSRLSGSGETLTDAGGNFVRQFASGENVAVTQSGVAVVSINERSGKVELKSPSYRIVAKGAEKSEPMTVSVRDGNGKPVYWQSFALPDSARLERVERFSDASENGAFVRIESDLEFVRNAGDSSSLPGGAFLVNENRDAVAGIGRDGNVYLIEKGYSLGYRNEGDWPVITIKNSFGITVAEVLYRLDAEYVIK